jgi:hypothetical protein
MHHLQLTLPTNRWHGQFFCSATSFVPITGLKGAGAALEQA